MVCCREVGKIQKRNYSQYFFPFFVEPRGPALGLSIMGRLSILGLGISICIFYCGAPKAHAAAEYHALKGFKLVYLCGMFFFTDRYKAY